MYSPDGNEQEITMDDTGMSFDLLANDGVYGAKFTVPETGMYRITTLFEGTLEDGTPFMRSAEHAMVAVEDSVSIVQSSVAIMHAASAASSDDQFSVFVPVKGEEAKLLRVYAEVYGTVPGTTELKAACWVGGYVAIENSQVELEINKRWLATAGVAAPIVLKQLALYDGDYHVPLATAATLPVSGGQLNLARTIPAPEPTDEMRHGVRPARYFPETARKLRSANATAQPSLVLLHGYCARDNPWVRKTPIEFTDYVAYEDLNRSDLTHQYATKVVQAYDALPSYGLVGHSQGGMTSLHIRNFFWSPNDAVVTDGATATRPVQSMGSPYHGVSGAGAALDLGALFGVGCGENFDLTTDGANLWQSGLESTSVAETFFYTTVYKYTFLHPRYCNLASNLVLKWPNDGTAEYEQCLLPGATHVDNTEGECHSVDMKWPPQTENARRNKEINAAAAR